MRYNEFYIPRSKRELIENMIKWWPQEKKIKFRKMGKSQLYAIYFKQMKGGIK